MLGGEMTINRNVDVHVCTHAEAEGHYQEMPRAKSRTDGRWNYRRICSIDTMMLVFKNCRGDRIEVGRCQGKFCPLHR